MELKKEFSGGYPVFEAPLDGSLVEMWGFAGQEGFSLQYYRHFVYRLYTGMEPTWGEPTWDFDRDFLEDEMYKALVGLSVFGIPVITWNSVFKLFVHHSEPFSKMKPEEARWWEVGKGALKVSKQSFLPPLYPRWLYAFGYTQQMYLCQLAKVWNDILPIYHEPWESIYELGAAQSILARMDKVAEFSKEAIDMSVNDAVNTAWRGAQSQSKK